MKKPTHKNTSGNKKKKLILEIHKKMRLIALKRHNYCVCCGTQGGSTNPLQGGHFIPVSASKSVRFDLINVNTQCRSCNGKHRYNTTQYTRWFLDNYGRESLDELAEKAKTPKSWKVYELEQILDEYKELLNKS